MHATTDTSTAPLELPPASELEARLQAARQEAALVKRLLKVRRDLDAAEEARRRRLLTDTPPAR
jgi:hypothetical protein